jgi:hypothetical protein
MSPSDPPAVPDARSVDVDPEVEAELDEALAAADEDRRTNNLVAWEALFPPQRLTG